MLRRKAHENYQNLSEKEKHKKFQYARNRYRQLFIENEHSEKVKDIKREYARSRYESFSEEEKLKKSEYALAQYRNLSEEKSDKNREYAPEQYKKLSEEEKEKSENIGVIDIESKNYKILVFQWFIPPNYRKKNKCKQIENFDQKKIIDLTLGFEK